VVRVDSQGPSFDSDPEMAAMELAALRTLVQDQGRGVTVRARGLLELGRRTGSMPDLLPEVIDYVRSEQNQTARVIGIYAVSQFGLVGLLASGSQESMRQAKLLAMGDDPHGLDDLEALVDALGGTWPT
jgi:hypothetical protein